jgi:hypothetical protein
MRRWNVSQYTCIFVRGCFAGKAPMPKAFATDADVVAYVKKTKGASYPASGMASGDARALEVKWPESSS